MFKKCMVEEGIAHAALVVRDGEDCEEAIAWVEYGTPAELPDVHHSKQYLEPDHRITCIVVDGTKAVYERAGFDFIRPRTETHGDAP